MTPAPLTAIVAIEKAMAGDMSQPLNAVDRLRMMVAGVTTHNFDMNDADWLLDAITDLLAAARKAEALQRAITSPFCVVFLDGRNEHGTHVLPSFPASFAVVDDDLAEQAEAIMVAAEAVGFGEGDHVWAEFGWQPPQIGDEGRVEFPGYWDFRGINTTMSTLLKDSADANG